MQRILPLLFIVLFLTAFPAYAQLHQDSVLSELKSLGFTIDDAREPDAYFVTEPSSLYNDSPLTAFIRFRDDERGLTRLSIMVYMQKLSKTTDSLGSAFEYALKANSMLACGKYQVFETDTTYKLYLVEIVESCSYQKNIVRQILDCMKSEARRPTQLNRLSSESSSGTRSSSPALLDTQSLRR